MTATASAFKAQRDEAQPFAGAELFQEGRNPEHQPIKASSYQCRDPRELPRRPWVYGRQLLRGSLSVIVAPGAVGKTSLMAGIAIALATGRPILGKEVWGGSKKVWLWNLEDSGDELSRLIEAARLHWSVTAEDLAGNLFVDSALDGAGLCVATEDHAGFRILEPVIAELVAELIAKNMDVLMVDPFVSSHGVSENNNGAIDAIAKKWARVGVQANCAIALVHHTKKLNGGEANADAARGASALPNAARSVIALNRMSYDEATQWGIKGEDRRRHFRAYDDKNNRAPPASGSDWYELVSVDLGNGPDGTGDNMPVVVPWTPPHACTGVTAVHLVRVQDAVRGGSWKADPQSEDWVGVAVAEVLDLDASDRKGRDAARIKQMLKQWTHTGVLKKETRRCGKTRKDKPFIVCGEAVQP